MILVTGPQNSVATKVDQCLQGAFELLRASAVLNHLIGLLAFLAQWPLGLDALRNNRRLIGSGLLICRTIAVASPCSPGD